MRDNEMDLLLRSFDEELNAGERRTLASLLETSDEARTEHERLLRLRGLLARSSTDAFAPDFADRVMRLVPEDGLATAPPNSRHQEADDRPISANTDQRAGRELRGTIARTEATVRKDRHRRASWRFAVGFAVAAVLGAAIGLAIWLQPRTVTVPYGSTQTVELSDGSVAELSSGSSLTYRNFLGRDERRVTLEGEAFFEVYAAERPFIVETFNASISVLGTRFNVRAWSNDPIPETSVALESGRVAVAPLGNPAEPAARPKAESTPDKSTTAAPGESAPGESAAGESPTYESATGDSPTSASAAATRRAGAVVILEPGQATSVVRDSAAVRPPKFISLDHVVAWRSGGLAFVDQPVGSVFNTVERRFDVDVQVTDPAILNRLLTYLNPHPRSAEDVLSDVCHTLDLHYRHTANGYEILP